MDYYMLMTYIFTGLIGLCVGSFLNVVIYRVPNRMSIAFPASHCPSCDYELRWYDNIPVVSYIILGGKCRSCKKHISFRYTIVEITNTVLWLLSVAVFWKTSVFLACVSAAACSLYLVVFFIDYENMFIPDRFQILLAICAMAFTVYKAITSDSDAYISNLIGLCVGGGLFLVFYFGSKLILKREGLGFGDVKLAAASGLLLGWGPFLLGMLIASLIGSVVLVAASVKSKDKEKREYPFAPFLTFGFTVALLAGDKIIEAYLSFLGGIA